MSDWTDDRELELLGVLRDVLDAEHVGFEVELDAAKAAFGWREVDDELARLTYDSAVDRGVLVRGGGGRSVVFAGRAADGTEVEVEVEVDDGRVFGQIVPAQVASVEIIRPGGEWSAVAEASELGVFRFDGVPRGVVALRVTGRDGGWSVRTESIVL